MLLALLLAALAGTSLEDLTREADRIVVANVVSVRWINRAAPKRQKRLRVTELVIEHTLLGPPENERLHVVEAPSIGEQLAEGTRALFFLGAPHPRTEIHGNPAFELRPGGAWRFTSDGSDTQVPRASVCQVNSTQATGEFRRTCCSTG